MNRILKCKKSSGWMWGVMALALAALFLTGCRRDSADPSFAFPPGPTVADTNYTAISDLVPGQKITVTFSDLPASQALRPLDLTVGEDGKISLYYGVTVTAGGKTLSRLQKDIQAAYVPKLFKQLTITVQGEELVYYVGGEVRRPDRRLYAGHMTVLRAIDTAGGFTDFADRGDIELRKPDGRILKVDAKKARRNPGLDLEVLPNDQVWVPRRWY